MYLSAANCFILDEIVKSFEVAYRSYVAHKLLDHYPTEMKFFTGLQDLKTKFVESSVVHSAKYKGKLNDIIKEQENVFATLQYCNKSLLHQDYENNNVPYVSQLIDFTLLFFNPYFKELSNSFVNIEQFVYYSMTYLAIRNSLSHPASSKILVDEAREIITFIKKIMGKLDDGYFWYVSDKIIFEKIEKLIAAINNNPIKIHNLNDVTFQHRRLLSRESELKCLQELLIGTSEHYRNSGSVVVYGYGGIGKTALIFEFINRLIKDINDEKIKTQYDFLLFFSSKEEVLEYAKTTGDLYINPIRKQVISFEQFKKNLFDYLEITDWTQMVSSKISNGIVVIDNFETFAQDDKKQILNFIRSSPRTVQYIITSRNEERCDDRLYLQGFDEDNNGLKFVNEYITTNNLNIVLSEKEQRELIASTKGNTLILILALERLDEGKVSLVSILSELNNVASQNAEIIADFMYKNSFDQTLYELQNSRFNPIDILRVISLYDEPIDLFSISTLTDIKIRDVETTCNYLATKLILNKNQELFSLNEFANKFIFIKFMPDKTELRNLKQKIVQHKNTITSNLSNLEELKKRNSLLNEIMSDWKPKNYIDQIAISETFNMYAVAKRLIESKNVEKIRRGIKEFDEKFQNYELRTAHPYVRCQKARVFKLFLESGVDDEYSKKVINDYFEQTIYSVQFDYTYCQRTKSYASVLWIYGIFLNKQMRDYVNAVKYLEESKRIFEELKIKDATFYKMLSELSWGYFQLYNTTSRKEYAEVLMSIYKELQGKRVYGYNLSHFRLQLYNRLTKIGLIDANRII